MNNTLTIEKVIVNTNKMSVYTFCNEDNEQEKLNKAIESNNKDMETWSTNCIKYPDWEDSKKYLQEAQKASYKIMTYEEYLKLEKEYYLSLPLEEITEEKFTDMLEVLPPLKWVTINGTNEFLMREFWTGSYTQQYARKNERFYSKMVDANDQNTWIHNLI